LKDWQNTTNPPHASAGPAFASSQCATCHSFDSWLGAKFDHSTTGFLLTNGHANLACSACHINNNYNLTSGACQNCHLTQWQQTNNPPHSTAGPAFAASNCSTCHNTVSWTTAIFNHSTTGFLLTNGHANVPCSSCHINNNYNLQIAPTDCGNSGCHLSTWQGTNNPTHSTAGSAFAASNCSTCHDTVAWTDISSFNHAATGFALVGTHMSPTPTPCVSCHVNNNYTLSSTDCLSCHQSAWNSTQTLGGNVPNHVAANFPTSASACSTCHTITAWSNGVFDHSSTGFPLTNSHQLTPAGKVTACTQCHIGGNYNLSIQPTDCGNSGCHLSTWQGTNNPTHSTAGSAFATANCSTCHDTIAWTDISSFNHASTGFALVGTHMSPTPTPCLSCHISNNYNLTSTDCLSCHQSAWNSTQTLGGNVPNHVAANFPSTASACSTCHTITAWANGVFDHSSTGFPLANSHQLAPAGKVTACTQCHIGGNYNLTIQPTDCGNSGCHLSTWQQTNNPTHSAAGPAFASSNCSTCHDTIAWTDISSFNHSSTGFALTGAHLTTACALCHVNNNYNLTSANTDCYGCHQSTWNSTQTLGGSVPNHITAGFPTSLCSTCHNTVAWNPGMFNHTTTGWALTGAHVNTPCSSCHLNNNYSLTAANTACYGCHLADWNSTQTLGGSVPNHISAGYPTTCDTCHTTTNWLGATFNHTYFPIPHHGSVCSDCHQVSTNYASFTCINCHTQTAHQQAQTNNTHADINGYSYGPTTCYNCHKNGGGG
jgi:endogenous inhibitor of DNA gyrase (YacG/DUF329 family)